MFKKGEQVMLHEVSWFFNNCLRDTEGNFWHSPTAFSKAFKGECDSDIIQRVYLNDTENFPYCLPLRREYMKYCGKVTEVEDLSDSLVVLKHTGRKHLYQNWMIRRV